MKKVYLVAFICALIAGGATLYFAQSLEAANQQKDTSKVQVVKALQDVPSGTQITSENAETLFAVALIDASGISANSVTSIESLLGKTSTGMIYAGEQVNASRFDGEEEIAGISFNLRDGYIAYSIAAESVKGVDGYLVPGDTVDVIALEKESKEAEVVMTDLKVLKVSTYEANANSATTPVLTYGTVTLEIKVSEAEQLMEIENSGKYTVFRLVLNKRIVETEE